jgi:hypothetical protein
MHPDLELLSCGLGLLGVVLAIANMVIDARRARKLESRLAADEKHFEEELNYGS